VPSHGERKGHPFELLLKVSNLRVVKVVANRVVTESSLPQHGFQGVSLEIEEVHRHEPRPPTPKDSSEHTVDPYRGEVEFSARNHKIPDASNRVEWVVEVLQYIPHHHEVKLHVPRKWVIDESLRDSQASLHAQVNRGARWFDPVTLKAGPLRFLQKNTGVAPYL
jgi:hypothetical protein